MARRNDLFPAKARLSKLRGELMVCDLCEVRPVLRRLWFMKDNWIEIHLDLCARCIRFLLGD